MESWWPLPAWLSSGTAMFLFFNVLVGAVAVMSRGQQRGGHGRRLCRCASSMVLGRLRSFSSMFAGHPAAEWYDHATPEEEELPEVDGPVPEPAAAQPPSAAVQTTAAAAMAEAPVLDEAVAEEVCAISDEACAQAQQHHAPEPSPSPPAAVAADFKATAVLERPAMEAPASVKRRERDCRREAEEVLEAKAELNERAELFIQQFREDLKLQRLNSIINYTRALRRRAGAALSQE